MNDSDISNKQAMTSRRGQAGEDDFVVGETLSKRAPIPHRDERRLHLRAFDYWHGLNADRDFPLFSDLTPDGLSPFKDNCLLLAFTNAGPVVRFCGARVQDVLGGRVDAGAPLATIDDNEFAAALLHRFSNEEGRTQAAEFEFVERLIESRGIMLPFSAKGDGAQLVMVVVNYRQKTQQKPRQTSMSPNSEQKPESDALLHALKAAASACSEVGSAVVHPGNTSRQGLYSALAQTYAFHIAASKDPSAYRKFLRTEGLRQQRRAPFTPALKLTFGKNYDKTRITEYAAALSSAARHEIDPDGLVDFLNSVPGGIKGCVQSERALKKGDNAEQTIETAEVVLDKLRQRPAVQMSDIHIESEFSLALVRRGEGGAMEMVAPVGATQQQIVRAAREILSKRGQS